MYQKIKSFLTQGNRAQWCVFILFALLIFIKCVLFHWSCFHSLLISSLWKEPFEFFAFWLPKINVAIFLASFIFVFPKKWWTFVVALLIDLWCISNLMYFRANELLIAFESIMMTTNLKGFEGSITTYWNYQCTILLIQTILYGILLYFIPKLRSRKVYVWLSIFLFVFLLRLSTQICRYHYADKLGFVMENVLNLNRASYMKNILPYREVVAGINESIHFTGCISNRGGESDVYYMRYHSIIAYFPKIFIAYIAEQNALQELRKMGEKIDLQQVSEIELLLHEGNNECKVIPQTNLIVLIVESFESWLIGALDDNNQPIMPNINHFVNKKANVYCNKVKSQVREGVSGDGQMIINTGILPLKRGSAALLFGTNTFPNWAHFFHRSVTIYSGSGTEWNQDTMTVRYNYQCQINPINGRWEDEETLDNLIACIDTISKTRFACQTITVSTHTPFVNHHSNLAFSQEIPRDLQKYINCIHYTDSCIGIALKELEAKGVFDNTVIVITGDHTIFKKNQLKEYEPYITNSHLGMNANINYVPLIAYSPFLTEKYQITDTCYQMDIYPTILHLIGCEDYYWKGFGVNLLDSAARNNRPIAEKEAYELSDKLIRSNYFSSYANK